MSMQAGSAFFLVIGLLSLLGGDLDPLLDNLARGRLAMAASKVVSSLLSGAILRSLRRVLSLFFDNVARGSLAAAGLGDVLFLLPSGTLLRLLWHDAVAAHVLQCRVGFDVVSNPADFIRATFPFV